MSFAPSQLLIFYFLPSHLSIFLLSHPLTFCPFRYALCPMRFALKSAIRNPKSEIAATNTSMDQQNDDTDASNGDNGTGAGSYIQATDRSPGFRF